MQSEKNQGEPLSARHRLSVEIKIFAPANIRVVGVIWVAFCSGAMFFMVQPAARVEISNLIMIVIPTQTKAVDITVVATVYPLSVQVHRVTTTIVRVASRFFFVRADSFGQLATFILKSNSISWSLQMKHFKDVAITSTVESVAVEVNHIAVAMWIPVGVFYGALFPACLFILFVPTIVIVVAFLTRWYAFMPVCTMELVITTSVKAVSSIRIWTVTWSTLTLLCYIMRSASGLETTIVTTLGAGRETWPASPHTITILTFVSIKSRLATTLSGMICAFHAIRTCCVAIACIASRRFLDACRLFCSSCVIIIFTLVSDGHGWMYVPSSTTLHIDWVSDAVLTCLAFESGDLKNIKLISSAGTAIYQFDFGKKT